MVCWWWTPCSCASNDSLPNTQLSLIGFGFCGNKIWVESNLGKARDQDWYGRNGMSWSQHMSRWFSLRTYELELCMCSDSSLFWMKRRWRGIYSLHTKSNRYTQSTKLGGTESLNSVRPIQQIMWPLGFSVGPECNSVGPIWLGLGHNVISVRPITQTRWDRFW